MVRVDAILAIGHFNFWTTMRYPLTDKYIYYYISIHIDVSNIICEKNNDTPPRDCLDFKKIMTS